MTSEAQVVEAPDEDERVGGTMTLLEHLLELRRRVTWAAAAVVVGMIIFVPFGSRLIIFLQQPAIDATDGDFQAQAITPLENIVVFFRVVLLGGVAVGMPMLVYQFMRFVNPALTPTEKKWIYPITVGASASFVLGMAFAYYVVLPPAYKFLFSFGRDYADPVPTISSYIDLTTRLIFVLGLVFETPIIVMGLARLGVVSARRLLRFWRFAIVGGFAISAVLTPTPDPVTQSLVAGPMIVLYFIGIGLAWFVRRG